MPQMRQLRGDRLYHRGDLWVDRGRCLDRPADTQGSRLTLGGMQKGLRRLRPIGKQ